MKKLICTSLLIFTSIIFANENAPYHAIVYGVKENRSMIYNCIEDPNGYLNCQFSLVSVRKKINDNEVQDKIKEQLKSYKPAKDELTEGEACEQTRLMLDVLSGKKEPPDKKAWGAAFLRSNENSRKDLVTQMSLIDQFCTDPNKDNYKEFITFDVMKENRTCLVSSQEFEQKFELVQDYNPDNLVWSVVSKPYGPCGIRQLDRFERVTRNIGDSNIYFWDYFAKKFVTNKKGETALGFSCSELDEEEYEYTWRKPEAEYVGCDYIEHSVF